MNGSNKRKMNKQYFKNLSTQGYSGDQPITNKRMIHQAYLSLGSNIRPEANLRRAVEMLRSAGQVEAVSQCYETMAVGSDGKLHNDQPSFLNMALHLSSPIDADTLKTEVIAGIEHALGRVRTADKYAPRPIDLDIIVFDGKVLDTHLWQRVYLALPFSELLPDLVNPDNGETLWQAAHRLLSVEQAVPRPELVFS